MLVSRCTSWCLIIIMQSRLGMLLLLTMLLCSSWLS
jgi:hypothetical protein